MILIIDLEATCAADGSIPAEHMEIIEVGAVWATLAGEVIDRFQSFVRPIKQPQLTEFCHLLTHINQADIDSAQCWPTVSGLLASFAKRQPGQSWGSWGNYDARQIAHECARHGIENPLSGLTHVNLKAVFAKQRQIKQVGMSTALQIVGLPLDGSHHRGLDDAINIAKLLPQLFSLAAQR